MYPLQAATMGSGSTGDTKRLLGDTDIPIYSCSESSASSISVIYIKPEKEAAARRKFDKYFVPVSLIFIILSALDRNSVSEEALIL
jgi:hypothetical protein